MQDDLKVLYSVYAFASVMANILYKLYNYIIIIWITLSLQLLFPFLFQSSFQITPVKNRGLQITKGANSTTNQPEFQAVIHNFLKVPKKSHIYQVPLVLVLLLIG